MSLGEDEIERLMDETVAGRGLNKSLYCATCGYNLRGLPYRGACPECGQRYNARSYKMTGIFMPGSLKFPTSELLLTMLSLSLTVFLTMWAMADRAMFIGAGTFAVFSVLFIRFTSRKIGEYLHLRRLTWRIDHED